MAPDRPVPGGVLTDDDYAAIVLAADELDTASIATARGLGWSTVNLVRRNLRAGAWGCALVWLPCSECGEPIGSGANRRRAVHPGCLAAKERRLSAERRAAGTAPISTPYVARWRADHADHVARQRVKERVRRRETKRGHLTEADLAKLDDLRDRADRWKTETRARANNSGAEWTAGEDKTIAETTRIPAREVALALGRTYSAVLTRRHDLRTRGLAPPPHRAGDEPARHAAVTAGPADPPD